jgi:NDP-sugar pyrophosphorylase family protein
MNSDVLTDLDFGAVLAAHRRSGSPLTVATAARTTQIDFGVLDIAGERIVGFSEKPSLVHRVSMGVYGMTRDTLNPYPEGKPLGFDQLVLDLIKAGCPPAVYDFDGFWLDIGRPDDYDEANRSFAELQPLLLPGGARAGRSSQGADGLHAEGPLPGVLAPTSLMTERIPERV